MEADAVDMSALLKPPMCANTEQKVDGEVSLCLKEATLVCSKCKLVQYCSKACQVADWKHHKVICNSKYLKDTYIPGWVTEGRMPAFMGGPSHTAFGSLQYFWGNVPALDLLQGALNEGEDALLRKDIALLFAASGDLRNVVKTVVGIPEGYSGTCSIVINDFDFAITARNAIILLIALFFKPETAVPMILHLWYSAMLPVGMILALHGVLLPCITEVCDTIRGNPGDSVHAKTFQIGQSSVRLILRKCEWFELVRMFVLPNDLTPQEAQSLRRAVTLARVDHIDRAIFRMLPGQRAGSIKFRQDGVLLPYGTSREDFIIPNPTFFQEYLWPMMDNADPLDGWSRDEFIRCAPAAKSDVYGALFFYLRDILLKFCTRVRSCRLSFQLFSVNALELPTHLKAVTFDRIEVSNICDRGYIGPESTLAAFTPMLKAKSENPHATLLMLFLNAVKEEESKTQDSKKSAAMRLRLRRIDKYLGVKQSVLKAFTGRGTDMAKVMVMPDFVLVMDALLLLGDFDRLFQNFLDHVQPGKRGSMSALARKRGAKMKSKHTIIGCWPYRVTDETSNEEFKIMLSESTCGHERYVEFEKVDENSDTLPPEKAFEGLSLDVD